MFQKCFNGLSITVYPGEYPQGLKLSCLNVISVNENKFKLLYLSLEAK